MHFTGSPVRWPDRPTVASYSTAEHCHLPTGHGVTEMNVFLMRNGYGSEGFKDPGFWDTKLTENGERQAKNINANLAKLVVKLISPTLPQSCDHCKWLPCDIPLATGALRVTMPFLVLQGPVDLIVCSPLTRALKTAHLAFEGTTIPRIVNADIRCVCACLRLRLRV